MNDGEEPDDIYKFPIKKVDPKHNTFQNKIKHLGHTFLEQDSAWFSNDKRYSKSVAT